jgi:hypothetical protein
MGEFTDNMENKLTKHNTENSKLVLHVVSEFTNGFKQCGSFCTLFEFSVLCLVNLFSMLSVSSPMVLISWVRVVHCLSFP